MTLSFLISFPEIGDIVLPTLAYKSFIYSYISELVPTVDLGFELFTLCSIAIAGDKPSILLTFGLFNFPKNCLAYDDKLSINLL